MSLYVFIIGLTILTLDLWYFNFSPFVHIIHVIKFFLLLMPTVGWHRHVTFIIIECWKCRRSTVRYCKYRTVTWPRITTVVIIKKATVSKSQNVKDSSHANNYLRQEAQLSPRYRAMRRVNWNLASCHATVQKLLIRQVLTKSMVWSWRFSRRQCAIDNVHLTMTRPSRLPLSRVS